MIKDFAQAIRSKSRPAELTGVDWERTELTFTLNSALSSDGRVNATRFAETATSGYHYTTGNLTDVAGLENIVSAYVKRYGNTRWVEINLGGFTVNYDIINGIVGTVVSATNAQIKPLGDGWFYIAFQYTGAGYSSVNIATGGTGISANPNHTGVTTDGYYLSRVENKPGVITDISLPPISYLVNTSFEETNPFSSLAVEAISGGVTKSATRFTHGASSARCIINKADVGYNNGPHRSEIQSTPIPEFEFGEDYWVGFNCYLDNWISDTAAESIWQWHNVPNFGAGENWGTLKLQTPFSLQITNNVMEVVHSYMESGQEANPNGQVQVVRTPIGAPKNNDWTAWVIHCNWNYQNGHIRVWKDGTLVYEKTGHTYYNDESGPFHKIGIYKWPWSIPDAPTTTTSRMAYYDNWKIAKGANIQYADVNPVL